jgi:quinoprotein relay system zinc metallohydrolase 2
VLAAASAPATHEYLRPAAKKQHVSVARARWCVAGTSLAAILLAPPLTASPDAFELHEIAAGVFVHPGKPLPLDVAGHDDIANLSFVVGTQCVAVIDTGGSIRIGRALRDAVKHRSARPICYVIDTHVHVDHLLGNAAFSPDQPQFVGHAGLPAALERSRAFFLETYGADLQDPPSAAQIIAPGRTVAVGEDVVLELGGRHLTLRAWPTAHTDCDVTVYDSLSQTLFTGDLVFVQRTPALDGSILGWLKVLDALASSRVAHLVPGHGPAGSDLERVLTAQRAYLDALLAGVRREIAQGRPLQEAIRDLSPAAGPEHWLLWDETQPHNVARAYQELEWE